VLAVGLAALAEPVGAQVMHRVAQGETLDQLARRYYGDPWFAEVIARHNQLDGKPRPGVELRLPSASRHEVSRGESWNDLAARYWDEAALGPALARWCGVESGAAPAPGQTLTIPALVRHRLAPGETLVSLARRFYRDPAKASELARLNRVRDPRRLHAGKLLRIPLLASISPQPDASDAAMTLASEDAPRVAAASSEADVASGSAERTEISAELSGAINAYLDGSFEDALSRLEAQRAGVLASGSDHERSLLLRYLVFSYVAFDRADAACDSFAALRDIAGGSELDPDLVSPKVRETLSHCE
jgi:hypothetical protein